MYLRVVLESHPFEINNLKMAVCRGDCERSINSWVTRYGGAFEFAKICHMAIAAAPFNCNPAAKFIRAPRVAILGVLISSKLRRFMGGIFDNKYIVHTM